jgi:hypothetical protein
VRSEEGGERYDRLVHLYRERSASWNNGTPGRHDETREMLQRLAISLLSEPPVVKTAYWADAIAVKPAVPA